MKLSTNYEEHVSIVKKLQYDESFYSVREPFKNDFQKIYNDAKEKGITLSNAKEYLNSLTKEELSTLQNYTRLADEIDVNHLNDEGAYNLLLEHYEKFDFNNDGFIENGIAKSFSIIPSHFSNDEKKALVDTFNSMDSTKMLSMSILLMPPIKIVNNEYIPDIKNLSFMDIENRANKILDPINEKNTTKEFRDNVRFFLEELINNYNKIQEQKSYYKL